MADSQASVPLFDRLLELFRCQGDELYTGSRALCLPSPLLTFLLQRPTSNLQVEVQTCIGKVIALKVVDDQSVALKQPLNLAPCRSLHTLELKRIPLSRLRGLVYLREQLKTVVVERCLNDVGDLIAFCGGDNSQQPHEWTNLVYLNLSNNSITKLGTDLKLLPSLKVLDVSRNCLSEDHKGLTHLPHLHKLFISHNQLVSIPQFFRGSNLTVISLCYNRIESIEGIEVLQKLTTVDLQYNCLCKGSALLPLDYLHSLGELNLEGNPISYHPRYTILVAHSISTLVAPSQFKLDGTHLSSAQKKILRLRPSSLVMSKGLPSNQTSSATASSRHRAAALDVASGYHSADEAVTPEAGPQAPWALSESLNTPKLRKKRPRTVNISDELEQLDTSVPFLESFLTAPDAQKNRDRRKKYSEDWLQRMPIAAQPKPVTADLTAPSSEQLDTQLNLGSASSQGDGEVSDDSDSGDSQPYGDTFFVDVYESDPEDMPGKEDDKRMIININEHFLVERSSRNAKVLRQLDLHCLTSIEAEGDHLKLAFDHTRKDRRKVEYSTSSAQKLKSILQPALDRNQQNMIISPRYECLRCHRTFLKHEAVIIEDPAKLLSGQMQTQLQCPHCNSTYIGEHDVKSTTLASALGGAYPLNLTSSTNEQTQEQSSIRPSSLADGHTGLWSDKTHAIVEETTQSSVDGEVAGISLNPFGAESEEELVKQDEGGEEKEERYDSDQEYLSVEEGGSTDGAQLPRVEEYDGLMLEHSSLKLYCECELFQEETECLEAMIKVRVMTRTDLGNTEEDGLVVISNTTAYFLKILQPNFVDPASCITPSTKQPLCALRYIEIGFDYQFLFLDFEKCAYLLLFRDYHKCKDFSDKLPVIVSDVSNSSLLGIKVSDITALSLWYAVNTSETCTVETYIGLHCYYAIKRTTGHMQSGRCIEGTLLVQWMGKHLQMADPPQALCQRWLDVGFLCPYQGALAEFDDKQSYLFNIDKWIKTKLESVMQSEQKFFMCSGYQGVESSSGMVCVLVEEEGICLLEDNCSQWPLSNVNCVPLSDLSTPPYSLLARRPVTDVSSMALGQKGKQVQLEFFDDDPHQGRPWILLFQTSASCDAFAKLVADKWKQAFNVPMTVNMQT